MNTRGGTVPILMPVGTGSWRHNRVAGVGIEPTSGGYEPPEVPLLYPAMYKVNSFELASHLPSRPWDTALLYSAMLNSNPPSPY